jgi:signal transduction histidine kinase
MTFASDQKKGLDGLSPLSRRMLALRDAVFARWERRVRGDIDEARGMRHPILLDTLPAFYDNVAESVTPGYPRADAVAGTSIAAEHGGERARLSAYDHEALIGEYQILRGVIFEVLHDEGTAMKHEEIVAINNAIDGGIKDAVNAFTLVHSALRERFVAALTHDLRGPLGAAAVAAELIVLGGEPARMRHFATKVLDNIERTDAMIRELLDAMLFHGAHRPQLELAEFDIRELVREVCADSAATHGRTVEMHGEPVIGWWSRNAMKRALENMVSNAVKYSTPGTPISVKTDCVHERLLLSVHNEGNPIPPEDQESIFQMFRRAAAAKAGCETGWGIGLPYVRGVAESHGGSIAVDSSAERGTTFLIDIPVDARPFQDAPTLAIGPGSPVPLSSI